MPNTYLKASQIASMAVGLLYRDLVIARTVWTGAINPGEFTGALDDTVTMRVPARRVARKRTLRAGTAIVNDTSTEFGVPVRLDTDVYNGAPITDENLTLDIADFGAQILAPQIRAVVEGVETEIADEIENADYGTMHINPEATEFVISGDTDWFRVANRANRLLNEKFVPKTGRTLLVGAGVEEEIRNSDRFSRYDSIGPSAADALSGATIGNISGFEVVPTTEIDDEAAYAYHTTAFVLATRAPAVPRGATFAQVRNAGGGGDMGYLAGLSVRWLMDYDYTNTTDRSLVNAWVGTASVEDADNPQSSSSTTSMQRAVKITAGS